MAFNKLTECDKSDMALWARMPACVEFEREIEAILESCIRSLIKKPTEEKASEVRAYEKCLAFFEECRKVR